VKIWVKFRQYLCKKKCISFVEILYKMNFLRTGVELCRSSTCVIALGRRSVSGRSSVRKPLKRFKPTLTGDELFEIDPREDEIVAADQAEALFRRRKRLFKETPRKVDGKKLFTFSQGYVLWFL
jgi:hypothetical protein